LRAQRIGVALLVGILIGFPFWYWINFFWASAKEGFCQQLCFVGRLQ